MARVAFVGLGNMGMPMCLNLVKAGHTVSGHDLSRAACDRLAAEGGRAAYSLPEAVADAEYVISMLPTGKHVRKVYEEKGGVLDVTPAGALLIDSSTIDVESARAVNKAAAAKGLEMVDAPVTGAVPAAEAGRLVFMVGGTAAAFERAKPILAAMGANIFHVGEAGLGEALKICNNMMTGISMIAISEMLTLAEKLGLDYQTVYDVVTKGSANCWVLEHYCPVPGPLPASPANRDYEPGFTVAMMLKDMRLSQEAASNALAATPLAGAGAAIYQMAAAAGLGDRDFSAVFKLISGRFSQPSVSKIGNG